MCRNNFYIDQWLHTKKNKFKLLKEKKKGMWRVFSTGLKEIMVKICKNLAFSSKNKWVYSLRTKKKQFNMQWPVLISFSLSISFFSYISLFLCTSFFKIIVWDEKIRHCVGGCYIQWGFFNQWLFMTFFSTVNCFVSLLLSLHFSFSYRFFDCVYYYLVDV